MGAASAAAPTKKTARGRAPTEAKNGVKTRRPRMPLCPPRPRQRRTGRRLWPGRRPANPARHGWMRLPTSRTGPSRTVAAPVRSSFVWPRIYASPSRSSPPLVERREFNPPVDRLGFWIFLPGHALARREYCQQVDKFCRQAYRRWYCDWPFATWPSTLGTPARWPRRTSTKSCTRPSNRAAPGPSWRCTGRPGPGLRRLLRGRLSPGFSHVTQSLNLWHVITKRRPLRHPG